MAVVIPACNEESLLPRCLVSVRRARALLPEGVTSDLVVVADNCNDTTYAVAKRFVGAEGTVLRSSAGNVGVARALATRTALDRCTVGSTSCWLANTDADCEVPERWLLQQLMLAERGVRAVAGIVAVDSFAEHDPAVRERFRLSYHLHADGTHPHVHGANLGVRADAYLQAGGWGPLETAEDHDLWRRLRTHPASRPGSCRSDAAPHVVTGGRRQGRAPAGFAAALAAHNGAPQ